MKAKGVQENCIQQMWRLFSQKVYGVPQIVVDDKGLARVA
jgi:enoyl-[acyl-carrier protein] reductase/trans-2-enoyl-CoA reductase (NAD+)